MKQLLYYVFVLLSAYGYAQVRGRTAVNTYTPNSTLQIEKKGGYPAHYPQGVTFPNFSTVERDGFTDEAVLGTLIYNTTEKCLEMRVHETLPNGTVLQWKCIVKHVAEDTAGKVVVTPAGFAGEYVGGVPLYNNSVKWLVVNNHPHASVEANLSNAVVLQNGTATITPSAGQNTNFTLAPGASATLEYGLTGTPEEGILNAVFNFAGVTASQSTPVKYGSATIPDKVVYISSMDVLQGKINNGAEKLTIDIPYTQGKGKYRAVSSVQTTAPGEGGDENTLQLDIPDGVYANSGNLTATVTVSGADTEYLVKKMLPNQEYTIATFPMDMEGVAYNVILKGIGGVSPSGPKTLNVVPKDVFLEYDETEAHFAVLSNTSWQMSNSAPAGESFSQTSGTNSASLTYHWTAPNTTKNSITRQYGMYGTGTSNVWFTITKMHKPYYEYTNIIDVNGKEQQGAFDPVYQGKVNPGAERFFVWAKLSKNSKMRVRVKYDGAPIGNYAHQDVTYGDYDYEYAGNDDLWAYEYQLKENRTSADRKITLEVAFQKRNGEWWAWENIDLKNTNGTDVMQTYVRSAHYAQRQWSTKYAGATQEAQDVAYVYTGSAYHAQQGTVENEVDNNHVLVTSYTEPSHTSGWKLPADEDLQDMKIAGFIPNRPFDYGYSNTISATGTYNGWSIQRATFIDLEVKTQDKKGYGNAFYLYDKNGTTVWMPKNGMASTTTTTAYLTYNVTNSYMLRIRGIGYGQNRSNSQTVPGSGYLSPATCPRNGRTEYQIQHISTTTNITESRKRNHVEVGQVIGAITEGRYSIYNSNYYTEKSRSCTVSSWCYQPSGATFGPDTGVNCSAWVDAGSSTSSSRTESFSYRLVHD